VRFTRRASAEGETIYALFLDGLTEPEVTIRDLHAGDAATAREVATGQAVEMRRDGGGVTLVVGGPETDAVVPAVAITRGGRA
jgi:hypothetical protein